MTNNKMVVKTVEVNPLSCGFLKLSLVSCVEADLSDLNNNNNKVVDKEKISDSSTAEIERDGQIRYAVTDHSSKIDDVSTNQRSVLGHVTSDQPMRDEYLRRREILLPHDLYDAAFDYSNYKSSSDRKDSTREAVNNIVAYAFK